MKTRHPLSIPLLALAWLTVVSPAAGAQESAVQVRVGGPEGSVAIPELGAIAIADEESGETRIARVAAAEDRAAAFRGHDVAPGDIVLALNGTRIRQASDLAAAYDGVAIGDEVALGLRRDGRRWIERFTKTDPSELPQSRRVEVRMEGNPADMLPLMGLGVFFQRTGEGEPLRVAAVVPHGAGAELFEAGDELLSINGERISDPAMGVQLWEAIPTGSEVRIEIQRAGETLAIDTTKPEFRGRVERRS